MDINKHSTSSSRPARDTSDAMAKALDRTRSRVRAFNQSLSRPERTQPESRTDQVDISPRTAILHKAEQAGLEPSDLQKLKRLYQSGELNSPQRMLQAAHRLLGGE